MLSRDAAVALVKDRVQHTKWLHYANPVMGIEAQFDRRTVRRLGEAAGLGELDFMAGIAAKMLGHIDRLLQMGEPAQSEMLLPKLKTAVHILLWEGVLYVSGKEFYPYPE
ncbi:hypothetical protein AYO44_06935 [Planctomycetaceae bacterium SCGC AG-212-F19]|nr:hypothetical protein AYO44_06935 [Planctomycetaceae bacterium SCGC AG-212-F19]